MAEIIENTFLARSVHCYYCMDADTQTKGANTMTNEKIRNINESFGESIEFDSIEEMEASIESMGYMPEDGLKGGRDYETVAKVTEIQFFDYTREEQINDSATETIVEYSANIKIELEGRIFCAQWSGNEEEARMLSIPSSDENFWGTRKDQDWACENVDCRELEEELEKQGYENNFGFLEEHGERM